MYDPMTMLAEQHRRELMQAAEQRRLIEEARIPYRKPVTTLLHQALAAFGRRMIAWGTRLSSEPGATQRLNSRALGGDEPAISAVGRGRIVIEVR